MLRRCSSSIMPRAKTRTQSKRDSASTPTQRYPVTPDGHYFVVRGRLWRCTDPTLGDARRGELTRQLMDARRALRGRGRSGGSQKDVDERQEAHQRVQAAKEGLGERGPVWWSASAMAPVCDRKMVHNTPYAEWHAGLGGAAAQRTEDSATASSTSTVSGGLRRSSRTASGS